ncbi:MAG: D-serine ammonia-lyase [Clostridia bacterium]|nr:D-serine ammonia-lyase [Clostridia bacterium]
MEKLKNLEETLWVNDEKTETEKALAECPLGMEDIKDAESRLARFASYFVKEFPETAESNGLLESSFKAIPNMEKQIKEAGGMDFNGKLYLKMDSHLPISGSIKARGGISEVLHFAESKALEAGLITEESDYSLLASPACRELFSKYSIGVGSTGNLGLSIGIMSAKLGFKVTVHMSADARQWKKDMLRSKGVIVKEYEEDYSVAITQGRKEAEADPTCYFVDDENSKTLFGGYCVAALRLKKQLEDMDITVNADHPLYVYLPCGVGGGPGGVAFGLKAVFGDNAHCFFAEPTHSPCMILGMATGKHNEICVGDIGIDNKTIADGLAVGRASGFVGKVMAPFMDGCYTVTDEHMSMLEYRLFEKEGIFCEPSALAGMYGPATLYKNGIEVPEGAIHIAWATGGNMVPQEDREKYIAAGKALCGL